MATQSLPSTPKATPPMAAAPEGNLTPGKWRHPQLDEIVRRQNAATFDEKNVKKLGWNAAALIMTWTFGPAFETHTRQIFDANHGYHEIPFALLRLFFVFNILVALSPLFRPKDNLSDIPLTPTQRSLLGLDPAVTSPATPGTTFVTPPRYRLSTSRKASPASRSTSPMSANASFSERRSSIGTPFSPVTSPLFHKAVSNGDRESAHRQSFGSTSNGGRESVHQQSFSSTSNGGRESIHRQSFGSTSNGGRESVHRQSFGSTSPLARSSSFGESAMSSLGPSTPSPLMGKRGTLGVKNKWLYERSRRLSSSGGAL